ncbi:hypothetical protein L204_104539 [Cryptococcus depauperatus]|nr:hypothetical protein L204_03399 [Cryptococcus depauperatus CBS 7855]
MMESIEIHEIHTPPAGRRQVINLTEETPSPSETHHSISSPSRQTSYHNNSGSIRPATTTLPNASTGGNTLVETKKNNQQMLPTHFEYNDSSFGSSLPSKAKPNAVTKDYTSYIKPATPNAFRQWTASQPKQSFSNTTYQSAFSTNGYINGWPSWVHDGGVNPGMAQKPTIPALSKSKLHDAAEDEDPGEIFDINSVPITAEDLVRYNGDSDQHMQELLSGAIGDGENEIGDDGVKEGEDVVEGFAKDIRLMPHQVRGVRWMKQREKARKYGGILADDMGLGKTVQTLARIMEGLPTAADRKAGFRAGTLIVAPLAVMEQWATECKTKTQPGRLKITTHHGASRTKSGRVLENFDIVITTFQTLASEFGIWDSNRGQNRPDEDSDSDIPIGRRTTRKKISMDALFQTKWLRVVVDEAQNIKNKNTKAAKAAVALRAKYRWCLTGTPIQNNVDELFSLFLFLRAKPLDDWHVFKERISSLVKDGRTKLAMKRLHVVLKAIMLRRTKNAEIDGKKILNLPGRTVKILACAFDEDERAFYDALEQKTALTFNKFVKSGTVNANYTSVLTLLLRLRQACVHPSLVTRSMNSDADMITDEIPASITLDTTSTRDEADDLADILGGLRVVKGKTCKMCFVKLETTDAEFCKACDRIARSVRQESESVGGLPPTSAKIRMLLKLLLEVEEKSGGTEKTIVFSQFTSFLDLIEPFLKSNRIAYVRYDGSMKNDQRQGSLEKIRSHAEIRVILISFKAGSTGLNLTCCNNVILMDLWWNPALEEQAFDRAHRLGQKRDVNIWKLTIEETVEDRILALQDNKRELANAALSGQASKGLMKLTMDDIMRLFQRSSRHDEEDEDANSE